MKAYYCEGGLRNPDFRYKIAIKYPAYDAWEWCEQYLVNDEEYFERFYVDYSGKAAGGVDIIFQFEHEAPAVLFALKFVK